MSTTPRLDHVRQAGSLVLYLPAERRLRVYVYSRRHAAAMQSYVQRYRQDLMRELCHLGQPTQPS